MVEKVLDTTTNPAGDIQDAASDDPQFRGEKQVVRVRIGQTDRDREEQAARGFVEAPEGVSSRVFQLWTEACAV